MARVTVEDCLEKVNNRFALIHMAAKRVRQLRKGTEPTIVSKNKDVVISLREIAAGNVLVAEEVEQGNLIEEGMDIPTDELVEGPDENAPNDEKSEEAAD